MTLFSSTRPRGGARPAVRQPGPVTLAIRALRPNEAPTWKIRQALIDAEERQALRALRRRIKDQIDADLTRVDRCLHALDLMDGDADIEQDAGEMPDGVWASGGVVSEDDELTGDDEPSLGSSSDYRLNGTTWGANDGQDREEENEDGGDIQDEPHDLCADSEPSLCGITVNAMFATGKAMASDESEPSLGSVGGTAVGMDDPQTGWSQGGVKDHEAGATSKTHTENLWQQPGTALTEARAAARDLGRTACKGNVRFVGVADGRFY